ncbi:MAG: hypothetical protein J6J36_08330 [Clostridia bacterium]|nr:hypothetical protein [Clostridia bacterium]
MKDFRELLDENDMVAKIPAEYSEYLQTQPKELVFHDPENDEQAKIASGVKKKTLGMFVFGDIILLLILIYVIVTKNTFIVISLMGVLTVMFVTKTVQIARKKPQVVVGKAVTKQKKWNATHHLKNKYDYYVSIAVDEPEKAIHSMIPISKKDYERVEEGMRIIVVSSSGQGFILD